MKTILKTLAILFTTVLIAQNPIEKEIGEFSELKVFDLINVEMIKSNKNKVEISGDNANEVEVINKDGRLKIRLDIDEIFDGNKTYVKLYYTNVDIIDANEGAYITSDDKIKQYELVLKAQEGGVINVKAKLSEAEIKAVTGGIIELYGSAKHQDVNINTGGSFKGKEFKTEKTEVAIRAGGEADINASELVDIKIRAGGDVYIYGDPETVNENTALGGRIKHMNQ